VAAALSEGQLLIAVLERVDITYINSNRRRISKVEREFSSGETINRLEKSGCWSSSLTWGIRMEDDVFLKTVLRLAFANVIEKLTCERRFGND